MVFFTLTFPASFSKRRMTFLFLAISLLFVFIIVIIYQWIMALQGKDFEYTVSELPKPLGDVLLTDPQPIPGRSIFFLETSGISYPNASRYMLNMTARQACAIESAALHNPNFQVFVLFVNPRYRHQENSSNDPIIDAILSYPNVQLRQLHLNRFAAGTPVEDWLKNGQLYSSSYPIVHTSDLLRLIALYRFGGIYLDLDIILLRSLENMPPNFVGAESFNFVSNAVMRLSPTGFGHDFAASCLRDFQLYFNGKEWSVNGLYLITRVANRMCNTKSIKTLLNDEKRCPELKVLPWNAFYEMYWREWRNFFEPDYLEETLERTNDSYGIHLWNKMSSEELIKIGSNTAYGKIAAQNCPKSYAAMGEYY